jgi:hypothetical protein
MYVYSAPDEPASVENKVIRVPGGDRHVNIILVKTSSQDSSSQTEVIFILLEQDEHKNLVYVLLKKGEATWRSDDRPPQDNRSWRPTLSGTATNRDKLVESATTTIKSNNDFNSQLERRRRLERFMDVDDIGGRGRSSGRIHRHQKLILLRAVGICHMSYVDDSFAF